MKNALLLLLLGSSISVAQFTSTAYHIAPGASLPPTCQVGTGDVFFKTSPTVTPYFCSATDTWSIMGSAAGGAPGGSGTQLQYRVGASTFGGMSGTSWDDPNRVISFSDANANVILKLAANPAGDIADGLVFGINTVVAAPAPVGSGDGTAGGSINLTTPSGGNTTDATTAVGGAGGQYFFTSGSGGMATGASNSSTGGAGGVVEINTGTGGDGVHAGADVSSGGSGGPLIMLAFNGGNGYGNVTGTGGAGGVVQLFGGIGGSALGVGANTAGAGGTLEIGAGSGGLALNGTANTGGDGGNLTLYAGVGGTGSTANGAHGLIRFSDLLSGFALGWNTSSLASSYTLKPPANQGTGSLVNDGSGNLSWTGITHTCATPVTAVTVVGGVITAITCP